MSDNQESLYEDDSELEELSDKLRKFQENEIRRDAIEERNALLHLKAILETNSGRNFMKYLIKNFEVGELPERGVEGIDLHETIGFLRAGQSVFQMMSQANKKIAAELLAQIQGEKYEKLAEIAKLENGR